MKLLLFVVRVGTFFFFTVLYSSLYIYLQIFFNSVFSSNVNTFGITSPYIFVKTHVFKSKM